MKKIPNNPGFVQDVKQKPEDSGWSQFLTWFGIDFFGNKPATPPKEHNGPITGKCSKQD